MSNKPQNQSTFHCPLPNLKIIIQLVYCLTWIFTMLTIPNKNKLTVSDPPPKSLASRQAITKRSHAYNSTKAMISP